MLDKKYNHIEVEKGKYENWKTKNYFAPKFTGFDNYAKLFSDGDFWKSFLVLGVFVAMKLGE